MRAAGWGCTRAQTECDSGSVCRLLSPARRGSCGQHRQNLPGDCCFLFPKTTLDVVGVPPPLFPSCRSPAGRFNLCVPVSASSVFFFFCREVCWGSAVFQASACPVASLLRESSLSWLSGTTSSGGCPAVLLAVTSPASFLFSSLYSWGKGLFPLSAAPSPLSSLPCSPPTSLCPCFLKLLCPLPHPLPHKAPPTPTLAPCPHPSLIPALPCLLPFLQPLPCPSALPPHPEPLARLQPAPLPLPAPLIWPFLCRAHAALQKAPAGPGGTGEGISHVPV